ncbi:MAG: hypothetical protein A2252_11325 [Elusimicrobia bacterium RIFOXYA2_FULL_39_19]|nr:MAG: hypothetical protein A2252_11325 [Elusimicrobia bacterium RIFOXYA2_FULL_39_19]
MDEMDLNFKDAVNGLQTHKIGEVLTVKIVSVDKEGVSVDLGMKSEGFIPIEEFGQRGIPADFITGKDIKVVYLGGMENGYYKVSYSQARQRLMWDRLKTAASNNEVINGTIVKKIKGGFIVDIGLDAFLPMSLIDTKSIDSLNDLLNREIKVLISEINNKNKSIVVSHRKVVDIERRQNAEKILANIKADDVIQGTVTKLTDFGAFLDIGGGVEGLVHISDLAWHRVNKSGDVLTVGENISVKVLGIEKDKGKISLGLKQLKAHPWDNIEQKYKPGSTVRGRITSVVDFGAFAEIEPGVEGLIHVSELSWKERVENAKKLLKKGDEVELKVIEVNREKEKISLSLKKMKDNPWQELKNKYPTGTKIQCKVTKLAPFGVFVRIEDSFEGLIPIQDMSWTKKIRHPEEMVKPGSEIEAVVIEIKPDEERAHLSLKHLTQDPYEKYHPGSIVKGTIVKILDFGMVVKLDNDVDSFLHKSEMTRDRDFEFRTNFKMGDEIEAKVLRADKKTKKIDLSIKKLELDMEKELVKKYSNIPIPSLGQVLEEK